jgi:hypothetical protein
MHRVPSCLPVCLLCQVSMDDGAGRPLASANAQSTLILHAGMHPVRTHTDTARETIGDARASDRHAHTMSRALLMFLLPQTAQDKMMLLHSLLNPCSGVLCSAEVKQRLIANKWIKVYSNKVEINEVSDTSTFEEIAVVCMFRSSSSAP